MNLPLSPMRISTRAPLFLDSWTAANAEWLQREDEDFVLNDGTPRDGLTTKVDALDALILEVNNTLTSFTVQMVQRDALRVATAKMMDYWRRAVAYNLRGTAYESELPTLPAENLALAKFVVQLEKGAERWKEINQSPITTSFTPPLVLKDGTTLAAFNAAIATLAGSAQTLNSAEFALAVVRGKRDNAAGEVYEIMGLYRAGVLAMFPDNSPVVATLPTMQPRDTGHTPAAVALSNTYDPATNVGIVNWTASTDADFDHYSVKLASGLKYNDKDALPLGTITDPNVLSFTIPPMFLQPGATVWVVVDVVLTDDRHAQSNAVKFAVPA